MADLDTDDLDRLIRLLRTHPEQQTALRAVLLGDQMGALADSMRGLAEAQQRTEQRLEALAGSVEALAEAQQRTEQRLGRVEEQLERLARAQATTQRHLAELASHVSYLAGRVDKAYGYVVEQRYRERAGAYFARIARRLRLLSYAQLDDILDAAVADGTLTSDDAQEVRLADAVLRGRLQADDREAYLVVEASVGIDVHDVERAHERAQLLARTGRRTVAVVAGEWTDPEVRHAAPSFGVWQVTDGRTVDPAA